MAEASLKQAQAGELARGYQSFLSHMAEASLKLGLKRQCADFTRAFLSHMAEASLKLVTRFQHVRHVPISFPQPYG